MKSTIEEISSVQKRINIEVDASEVNKAFDDAYRGIQRKATIKGFRKGKAPLTMIRKLYGANVAPEVAEKLVNKTLTDAIKEHDLKPVATPVVDVEKIPSQDEAYTFKAVIDIMPAIEIADYKGLKVEASEYQVDDKLVDREIAKMQRQHAKTKNLEDEGQAAASGHLVTFNQQAFQDGKELPNFKADKLSAGIGTEELHPDLEKGITGMKVGDQKDIDVNLPKDFQDSELAGKKLSFKVELQNIQELVFPELDDEFAKDLNLGAETFSDLKTKVKDMLNKRAEEMRRGQLEGVILNQVVEKNPFEVPPSMVDQVIDSMINEMQWSNDEERQAALKNENIRKNLREDAKTKAKNSLILWRVAEQEKIEVTDNDVEAKLKSYFPDTGMNGAGAEEQLKGLMQSMAPRMKETLMFEKAMNVLIDSAEIKNIPAEM